MFFMMDQPQQIRNRFYIRWCRLLLRMRFLVIEQCEDIMYAERADGTRMACLWNYKLKRSSDLNQKLILKILVLLNLINCVGKVYGNMLACGKILQIEWVTGL